MPDQGADSLGSPHLGINYADLTEDSSPGTNNQTQPDVAHEMGQDLPTTRPSPVANLHIPVRGPTYTSTPPSPHCREEAYPKAGFPKVMKKFFFPHWIHGWGLAYGIYPWVSALVMGKFEGETFLGGLLIFFLGGWGGKRKRQGTVSRVGR